MKRLFALLLAFLPGLSVAGDYESTLLVQTGQLRESDLIVRTVTDLEENRICLAFYVRTVGTSPAISCYDAKAGFRAKIRQVGHFKDGKLVVRKLHDTVNKVSCLATYVSTEGTSPVIHCYQSENPNKESLERMSHLREGDMHVHKIMDPGNSETCLIAHVVTGGTAPALLCYPSTNTKAAGLTQVAFMQEGDLVVRKVKDLSNDRRCLVTYVSTEGTSPYIHCPGGTDVTVAPTPAQPAFRPSN